MSRRVAFRAYGRFRLLDESATPLADDGQPGEVAGVVEISFTRSAPDDLTERAYLAWTPRGRLGNPEVETSQVPPPVGADPLATAFRIPLDGDPAATPRYRLDGAAVLDQFALEASDETPELRLLLARSFPQGRSVHRCSVLLGHPADDRASGRTFGFLLAVATPAPHGVIQGVATWAVPFRLRFRSTVRADHEGALPPLAFAAGVAGTASEDRWVFAASNPVLATKPLGRFGLARSSAGDKYLQFPRSGAAGATAAALWLSDAKTYVGQLLAQFADVGPSLHQRLDLITGTSATGQVHNSVWFARGPTGFGTRLIFRSAVRATGRDTGGRDLSIAKTADNTGHVWRLAEPTGISRWLPGATDTLLVDLVLDYDMSNAEVWRIVDGAEAGHGAVEVRLHFEQDLDAEIPDDAAPEIGSEHDPQQRESTTVSNILSRGIRALPLARLGLAVLEAPQPETALPDIRIASKGAGRRQFCLAGRLAVIMRSLPSSAGGADIDRLVWQPRRDDGSWSKVNMGLTLWPTDGERGADPAADDELVAQLTFPGLVSPDPAGAVVVRRLAADPQIADLDQRGAVSLLLVGNGQPAMDTRVGAFAVRLAARTNTRPPAGDQWWRFTPFGLSDAGRPKARFAGSDVDFRLSLAGNLEPLAPDLPRGDNRPRPLLLPLRRGDRDQAPFRLDVRETVSRLEDRRLTIDVTSDTTGGSGSEREYVILSERPFSLLHVRSGTLGSRGGEDSAAVASYTSTTKQWSIRQVADAYRYTLPPQAVGESMDRPRRLEIIDADAEGDDTLPSAAPSPSGTQRTRALQMRLSPPATLWVKPTDVERSFYLPEWASHELFRQAGALGTGVALAGLRAEFLYGLAVSVDPAREQGAAANARVAEIEALLGRPVGAAPPHAEWQRRWNRVAEAMARRPERLELWMRDPASAQPFAPARFSDGVRFSLRDTAVVQSPFPQIRDEKPAASADGTPDRATMIKPHGLPGGAIWPIEQRAFCRALLEAPNSTGGAIERVALSPTGGDANARAEFLNGLLAIIAETRGGRVQRHQVEVIGRIGVFWHRAKHVVVYERTVSESAQFAHESEPGTVARRRPRPSRRPIIRKVEEYVELLQPERAYPDTPDAPGAAPGFLHALRFNSSRIHVDSGWSEEVSEDGWRIPLWNRRSAEERPSVYPRPAVSFVTHAEGDGDLPLVAQECLDPDNLWFYSDASQQTADTDRWAPVLAVDWTNLPSPAADQQPDLDPDAGATDRKRPSATRIPRGHRRFTWRLGPAARRTAINAGRGSQPIFASLDTLTFSRADAEAGETGHGAAVARGMAENRGATASRSRKVATVGEAVAALNAAVEAGSHDRVTVAAATLLNVIHPSQWVGAPELDAFDAVVSTLGRPSDQCGKLVGDFAAAFRRKRLLMTAQLRDWVAGVNHLPDPTTSLDDLQKWMLAQATAAIAPSLENFQSDVGNLRLNVSRARGSAQDFAGEVQRVSEQGLRRLDDLQKSYDRSKPWSPERSEELSRRLDEVREGVAGDVEAAASEARTRLSTEVDGLAQRLATEVAKKVESATRGRDGLLAELRRGEGAATAALRSASDAIDAVAEPALLKLREAAAQAESTSDEQALEAARKALEACLNEVRQHLGELKRTVAEERSTLAALIKAGGETLNAGAVKLAQAGRDALAELDEVTSAGLQRLVAEIRVLLGELSGSADALVASVLEWGRDADAPVARLRQEIGGLAGGVGNAASKILSAIDEQGEIIEGKLEALAAATTPDQVTEIARQALNAIVKEVLPESELAAIRGELAADGTAFRGRLDRAVSALERELDRLAQDASDIMKGVRDGADAACAALADDWNTLKTNAEKVLGEFAKGAEALWKRVDAIKDVADELIKQAKCIRRDYENVAGQLDAARAEGEAYADRVLNAAGSVTAGGPAAVPGNLLRLYAAAASAPALPNLDFARDRLGYYYRQLNSVIDTTAAEAWFGRLGDSLKALGLSVPFERIGEGIIPKDLSNFDIGRVLRNLGGIDLSHLFKGVRLPAAAKDAIKITHAFDQKALRAWVQIDVDLPLPGRNTLFTIGPFSLDIVDSLLRATVRLEASKDSERVEQSGSASLSTTFDASVSGQSMVALGETKVQFAGEGGFHVDLDPAKIRLNPAFRFIQNTIGKLVPEEAGGLHIVKRNGVPIGVEHEFSMPPVSLMAGTSGVSNIAIGNRFSLIAYPDFVIANRFALSRPDMPFLFSIFVIGGTGYVTVDCEYRAVTGDLSVTVEAAAGGSAALGFSAGPVSGSVYITLSIALSYRKVIGRSGGGLTASLILLVAGQVDVAGLATVHMSLLLRIAYREGGRVDGTGTLEITIRISRFFKFSVHRNVDMVLRGAGGGNTEQRALNARGPQGSPLLSASRTGPATAEEYARRAEQIMSARG